MRMFILLLPVAAFLTACGAPGAPEKPGVAGVTVTGEARIGVTGTL